MILEVINVAVLRSRDNFEWPKQGVLIVLILWALFHICSFKLKLKTDPANLLKKLIIIAEADSSDCKKNSRKLRNHVKRSPWPIALSSLTNAFSCTFMQPDDGRQHN